MTTTNFMNWDLINVGAILQPTHKPGIFSSTSATSGSINVAGMTNMPGNPTTTSITKSTGTNLLATMQGSAFDSSTADNAEIEFAVLVNGVDNVIGQFFYNTPVLAIQEHMSWGGMVLITGLAAGSYTALGRWRLVSGVGPVNIDGNDSLYIKLEEV